MTFLIEFYIHVPDVLCIIKKIQLKTHYWKKYNIVAKLKNIYGPKQAKFTHII